MAAAPEIGSPAPVNLDFLGRSRLTAKTPRFSLLDSLGFPWILSSES
jgi:hypothetical protein